MKETLRRNLIVGVFVTLGIILFITAIYLIGMKENIFGSPYKISAIFVDVKGLREGDKVRLSGIEVGTVSSIGFLKDNRVYIEMSVDEEVSGFIQKDSRVTIASQGLMGAKVVMILPGSMNSPPVSKFDTLETIEQIDMDDILREVNATSENIALVSEELISITKKINRGEGIFGKIFTDTAFAENLDATTINVMEITQNLTEISDKVNRGKGIVGKFFADTVLTSEIDSAAQNIEDIAQNLKEITDQINKGEGIFGRLFTDTSLTNNLYQTSENLLELTEKFNNDSSALHLLINDPTFADSLEVLIDRVNLGVVEATAAAEAVQKSGVVRAFSKDKKKGDRKK